MDYAIDPFRFREVVSIMNDKIEVPETVRDHLAGMKVVEDAARDLVRANDALIQEAQRLTMRRSNPFDDLVKPQGRERDDLSRLRHSTSDGNFIRVIYDVIDMILYGYEELTRLVRDLGPAAIHLIEGKAGKGAPRTLEALQLQQIQFDANKPAIGRYLSAVFQAEQAPRAVALVAQEICRTLDRYYALLLRRHSVEGIQIHGGAVATDIALSIFENTDLNGEIQDGKSAEDVSAYSVTKARVIASAITKGLIGEFRNPDVVQLFLMEHLRALWEAAVGLSYIANPSGDALRKLFPEAPAPSRIQGEDFKGALASLINLDPRNIVYKEKTGLLTQEERENLRYRNETLAGIVHRLRTGPAEAVIQYILSQKEARRKHEVEENSFYVCKIGAGNPFSGEAPGALSVIPGQKPTVTLDEVIGSGFEEVRAFLEQVKTGSKWTALFQATSPSRKVDKNNVLLVGPQGCGKTEVLRAVASSREALGIFAQASDFLTCWKGEAEKNPKRLFEAGLRLQRESNRPVYFLIDEIDTILNGDRGQAAFGGSNLATEFQVLMDGITTYPNLALWGATNHPERIPMPLIRRFARVIIVGELAQEDRIALLKQFVSFLPLAKSFPEDAWADAAGLLEGAVGDIVRKVADNLWRTKMTAFVHEAPHQAEKLVEHLHGGAQFEVGLFTAEKRAAFQALLRPHVQVTPRDLLLSVDQHLSNVAIQQEIATAKETYERARHFLSGINAR